MIVWMICSRRLGDNSSGARSRETGDVGQANRRSGLAVASTSLIVASLSLLVSYCAYHRLAASDRPKFVTLTSRLLAGEHQTLDLSWKNVGKKPARNGKAKVFALGEDDKRGDLLGEAEMRGTGTTIFAGDGGGSLYDVGKLPKRLLICATYYDDEETAYEQAFVLLVPDKRTTDNPDVLSYLDEAKTPDVKICR
jgi:hypothetical protein